MTLIRRHGNSYPTRLKPRGRIYQYYRCRSPAGGRPPCKGATDARVRAARKAWGVAPLALQRDFQRKCIARIELDETDSTAAVTFAPDAARMILGENG